MKHPLFCSAPTQSLWLTPCCFVVSGLLSFVGTCSYLWVVAGVIGKMPGYVKMDLITTVLSCHKVGVTHF